MFEVDVTELWQRSVAGAVVTPPVVASAESLVSLPLLALPPRRWQTTVEIPAAFQGLVGATATVQVAALDNRPRPGVTWGRPLAVQFLDGPECLRRRAAAWTLLARGLSVLGEQSNTLAERVRTDDARLVTDSRNRELIQAETVAATRHLLGRLSALRHQAADATLIGSWADAPRRHWLMRQQDAVVAALTEWREDAGEAALSALQSSAGLPTSAIAHRTASDALVELGQMSVDLATVAEDVRHIAHSETQFADIEQLVAHVRHLEDTLSRAREAVMGQEMDWLRQAERFQEVSESSIALVVQWRMGTDPLAKALQQVASERAIADTLHSVAESMRGRRRHEARLALEVLHRDIVYLRTVLSAWVLHRALASVKRESSLDLGPTLLEPASLSVLVRQLSDVGLRHVARPLRQALRQAAGGQAAADSLHQARQLYQAQSAKGRYLFARAWLAEVGPAVRGLRRCQGTFKGETEEWLRELRNRRVWDRSVAVRGALLGEEQDRLRDKLAEVALLVSNEPAWLAACAGVENEMRDAAGWLRALGERGHTHLGDPVDQSSLTAASEGLGRVLANLDQRLAAWEGLLTAGSDDEGTTALLTPGERGLRPAPMANSEVIRRPDRTAPGQAEPWGALPPRMRRELEQFARERFHPKYQEETARYYRDLTDRPKAPGD
jgi:hypothetical protein